MTEKINRRDFGKILGVPIFIGVFYGLNKIREYSISEIESRIIIINEEIIHLKRQEQNTDTKNKIQNLENQMRYLTEVVKRNKI